MLHVAPTKMHEARTGHSESIFLRCLVFGVVCAARFQGSKAIFLTPYSNLEFAQMPGICQSCQETGFGFWLLVWTHLTRGAESQPGYWLWAVLQRCRLMGIGLVLLLKPYGFLVVLSGTHMGGSFFSSWYPFLWVSGEPKATTPCWGVPLKRDTHIDQVRSFIIWLWINTNGTILG